MHIARLVILPVAISLMSAPSLKQEATLYLKAIFPHLQSVFVKASVENVCTKIKSARSSILRSR